MLSLIVISMLAVAPIFAAGVDTPHLPETPFDYEGTVLPSHFLSNRFPGATQGGAAVHHDSTPADNPVTNAGATLGRVLFHDRKLSANGTVACSSCHLQGHGFSDPKRLSVGFSGGLTRRHSMSLANARFNLSGKYFWDERADTLEEQVLMPFLDATEMGLTQERLVAIARAQPYYPALFEDAFGDSTVNADRMARALAQFVRSMVSFDSKYDRGRALVASPRADFPNFTGLENRGKSIFMTTGGVGRTPCIICHQSEAFVGSAPQGRNAMRSGATNNGLDSFSAADRGLAEATFNNADTGKFRVPSLRNVAVSAPFMHDGRFATLEDVVDHYSTGIQDHPNLSGALRERRRGAERYDFTADERVALVAFMRTLTDGAFLADERFSDPFFDPGVPTITRVASSASAGEAIGPHAWVSIVGRRLATGSGLWSDGAPTATALPTELLGTSVLVNGEPASVHSVSPRRINVLLPAQQSGASLSIQVTAAGAASSPVAVRTQRVAPELFRFDMEGSPGIGEPATLPAALFAPAANRTGYAVALHADGTRVGVAGLFRGRLARPARPGDVIRLYGTGLGATSHPDRVVIRVAGTEAGLAHAELVAPGLHELTVLVPALTEGELPVTVEVNGSRSEAGPLLTVRRRD